MASVELDADSSASSRDRSHPDAAAAMLELAPGVLVRPTAFGLIALVGQGDPWVLDSLQGRIVAMCLRPASRQDLIDAEGESEQVNRGVVEQEVDGLIASGVLSRATSAWGRGGLSIAPAGSSGHSAT